LKIAYGMQIEGLMQAHVTYITKEDFFPAFHAAYQATMTEKNIEGGFQGAGLIPFDPEREYLSLMSDLKRQHHQIHD